MFCYLTKMPLTQLSCPDCPTTNVQYSTFKIQHPTSNIHFSVTSAPYCGLDWGPFLTSHYSALPFSAQSLFIHQSSVSIHQHQHQHQHYYAVLTVTNHTAHTQVRSLRPSLPRLSLKTHTTHKHNKHHYKHHLISKHKGLLIIPDPVWLLHHLHTPLSQLILTCRETSYDTLLLLLLKCCCCCCCCYHHYIHRYRLLYLSCMTA